MFETTNQIISFPLPFILNAIVNVPNLCLNPLQNHGLWVVFKGWKGNEINQEHDLMENQEYFNLMCPILSINSRTLANFYDWRH